MQHQWLVFVLIWSTHISCTYSGSVFIGDVIEGFYWRDYTGDIPFDAFPGGIKPDEHAAYIGQVIYGYKGIPGKIDRKNSSYIYFEYGNKGMNANVSNGNMKILCTQHPQDFNWIPGTAYDKIAHVVKDGAQMIIAGYDLPYNIAVGRKPLSADVGKVLVLDNIFEGFHVSPNGQTGWREPEFDVLVYKPSTNDDIVVTGEDETVNIIIT